MEHFEAMIMPVRMLLYLFLVVLHFIPAFSQSMSSDDYVPCERGWYYFREKCYRLFGSQKTSERLHWSGALDRCKNYGADLVSIHSQEEQDFIVAFLLLDAKWWAWTGLNDRDNEGEFKWSDGSVFNYTNWEQHPTKQPSGVDYLGQDEDCVHLLFEPWSNELLVGEWNDRPCESESSQAFICKMNSNRRKRSPNLKYCSPEEGGGYKYESSCYHIVNEEKSWKDAERHCKVYHNGHLLAIRDIMVDYFIELGIPDIRREMWIGIKLKNQMQQKWTSGWFVSYDAFNKEETFIEGNCVARKGKAEWVTTPCSRQLPFICEVSKATPPVLKMPKIGAHCPTELDDWRDLGGDYCYYFQTTKRVNFSEARYDCGRRGGDLASLHSKEESDALQPFVIHKTFSVLIGLMRLYAYNEEAFGWLDGSKLDWQHWREDAPNRLDEKCVEAFTETMKWNDNSCDDKKYGYICSVKKIVPHSSLVQKTADCKNYCVAPHSYLDGLLSQCSDAKEIL